MIWSLASKLNVFSVSLWSLLHHLGNQKQKDGREGWLGSTRSCCLGNFGSSPRDSSDLKPELRRLDLESQLWAGWWRKANIAGWREHTGSAKCQSWTGDGPEADRSPGTPGADQNPVTSGMNLLIRALLGLRMEHWTWQPPPRQSHLFLTNILETFTCMPCYTR